MRIAQIRKLDISNGSGIGVALFVQGCPFHCKNCFNQDTWDFNGGVEFNDQIKSQFYCIFDTLKVPRLSILGGEPLAEQNVNDVLELLKEFKERFPDKIIWLYTGYTIETLNSVQKECLKYVDVLVDGQYVDELKDLSLPYRGSSNQRIIKMGESEDDV